jgi:hypothetical protein
MEERKVARKAAAFQTFCGSRAWKKGAGQAGEAGQAKLQREEVKK